MKLAKFSVEHSLFVNLLSAFLVIAGLVSMFTLRREAFPEVSYDVVSVGTIYKGASAEEVERLLTTPLEKELKEVDDIKEMSSMSREGFSSISLEMLPGVKNTRKVIDDIQTAVDRAVDLPDGTEEPLVTEITTKHIPAIIVSLSGNLSERKLQEQAEQLEDLLIDIDGVASVKRRGFRDREFWVEPDLEKMRLWHVSIEEIMQALNKRNIGIPGGKLKTQINEFSVKTTGEFYTKEEIKNVIIRANDVGNFLKVGDIANIRDTFEEENTINKTGGTRSVSLIIVKREKGDAIDIVNNVKRIKNEFISSAPKELKINTVYDLSFYIKRRLNVLRTNGLIAFIFVVASLLVFLHPIPALFTSLGIPIAMLTTFFVMMLSGLSINLISMFGLIIVLGMVVDDGIIISENVYRYIESGMPPREAAIKGTTEVIAPVTATILTSLAAFSPLLFMSGLMGKFMWAIPLVVCIALGASMIEAFVILPSHLADFARPISKNHKGESLSKKETKWFKILHDKYLFILNKALNHKYKVTLGMFILFIVCIILVMKVIPFMMFTGRGVEQFMIRAEAKIGMPLETTNEMIAPVEDMVSKIPQEYLDAFETQIGTLREERGHDPFVRSGGHLAQINVYLTPSQYRKKTAGEIVDGMRAELEILKEETGFEKLYFRTFKEGPPTGKPIYARIRGEDYPVILEIRDKMKAYLNNLKGVSDITDSYDLGNREFRIVVDQEAAAKSFLSIGEVAASVRNIFQGGVATSIKPTKAAEEINVLVRLPEEQRNSLDVFDNLVIPNKFGNLIPLNAIASIEETQGLRSIQHLEGKRMVSASAEVDNKNVTSAKANALLQREFKNTSIENPGYTIKYGGEAEETAESMMNLLKAFFLAILLIFLILATLFNSLVQPFMIISTIPLGGIGVVLAFLLHSEPLSFLAVLGVVGLAGIVVNDSIVLVDFINKLRKSGVDRRHSIVQAGSLRLRPVILTTITTVAGLSTVAYGIGGSDPFLKPMALAISWGLLFATVLTLIYIPCIYAILDDISHKFSRHSAVPSSK